MIKATDDRADLCSLKPRGSRKRGTKRPLLICGAERERERERERGREREGERERGCVCVCVCVRV